MKDGQGLGHRLARFAVERGVLVNLLFVILLIAGGYAASHMPVDAYPNVDLDAAVIYTIWIGASPEEIDTLVTARIEEEIEGIRGIERVISDSRPNRSNILVKFREDSSDDEIDRAFQDIRTALERLDDLPSEAERPVLRRQTVFEVFPVISVTVSYEPAEREPVAREVARELREQLLEVDGVAKVEDRNIREPEFTIHIDRARAERYDLTLEEIVGLLGETNRNVPAGEIGHGDGGEFGIKAAGNYLTIRDVEDSIIRQHPDGSHVRVRDVGRVAPGFEEREVRARFNGRDAITMPISKEEGRNSLTIVDDVRAEVQAFEQRGLPEGVHLGVALDSSQIIRDRLRILLSNLGGGMVLVFLALWAGIGVRNAVLAIIGIPFCYLVAILFMNSIGVSINAISLFAMVLVSGVIVDDALIVLENVYRHLEEKRPLREAIVIGAGEVFWPVFSSTLTTMSAFLPLLIMVGVTGEFFSVIPKVVVVTLLASIFECFVVLPIHYLDFGQRLRRSREEVVTHATPAHLPIDRRSLLMRWVGWLRPVYDNTLRFCLRHRYATLVVLLSAAILAFALWGTLDTVLFPSDFQVFLVNMEMESDASLEQTSRAAESVDLLLARLNREGPYAGEIEGWTTTVGLTWTEDNMALTAPSFAQAFVSLRQGTGADPVEIKDRVGRLIQRLRSDPRDDEERRMAEGLRQFTKVTAVPQMDGPPTGKPVAVRIRCDDLDEAERVARAVQSFLTAMPGVLNVADNHDEGRVEYSVVLRPEVAAVHGITFERVARTLAAANDGVVVSVFKDPGGLDDADVRVRLEGKDRDSVAGLGRVRLRSAGGQAIPLSAIARVGAERSHAGIYRYNSRRTVLVTAEVEEQVTNATAVNEALRKRFDTPAFRAAHPDVGLGFGGEYEETQKSFDSLLEAFFIAVLAIYMILAAQFRSYALPLVILLTVPFAFIGVVVGLFVTGNPFTITAGIAMIGLAGIAVNDAIVLVDFINVRRVAGARVLTAVKEGCRLRARPILLTSITTIAGLLPMALGLTGFSKLWSPFAATICFGILFSTLLTLLIVPSAYLIVEDGRRWVGRWRHKSAPPNARNP